MESGQTQFLRDKILSYEGAIKQIDEKINLISFIGSINHSSMPREILKLEELKEEKKILEVDLRKLKLTNFFL